MDLSDPPKIRRSPRYPFVDLRTAVIHLGALWTAAGSKETEITSAWKLWGYGPNSSGGIQTEAALKQFGLLDVVGRGKQRRLKVSRLGSQIAREAGDSPKKRDWIKEAALKPRIHQELWDRWQTKLPIDEVRLYLVGNRQFQERGAKALIAEYQKTMSFLDTLPSSPISVGTGRGSHKGAEEQTSHVDLRSPVTDRIAVPEEDFVDLRFEGDRLILSARLGREGIPKLIKILRANMLLVGRRRAQSQRGVTPPKRPVRRKFPT